MASSVEVASFGAVVESLKPHQSAIRAPYDSYTSKDPPRKQVDETLMSPEECWSRNLILDHVHLHGRHYLVVM
jgi:hypothetical protein